VSVPPLPDLLVSHWQLGPVPTALGAVAAVAYLTAALRLGRRWPLRFTLAFEAGIACTLIALDSGLDSFDDQLLSAHMSQHMILLLIAPLLLLSGRPATLALRTLHGARRRSLARALARARPLTRAWCCLVVFALVVVLTHLPAFYDATLTHPPLHEAEHGLYLLAGLLLWWPLLDGDPVLTERLGGLGRLIYLLLAMLPMALVGAYLNWGSTVVYPPYARAARPLGISALHDQATAGAIMWVLGNTVMVLVGLWAVMAALSDEERRQQARESYAAPAPWPAPRLEGRAPR
jgi:putative membrane protein